jgi:hypothetical protein
MGNLSTFQEELARVNNEIPDVIEDITAVFQELHRRGIPVPVLQGNGRTARVADIRHLKYLKDRRKALLEERQRHFDLGHFGGDPSVDSINAELDAIGSMGSKDVPSRTPRRHITTKGVYNPEELYLGSVLDDSSNSGSDWSGEGFPANINASFSNASRLGYPAKLSSSFSHSGRMIGGMTDIEATALALGSVGGLYVLNELYKFAYQRIMGRQRVPIQVAEAIGRHPVPRGIPQAIARVVQQELVPAHYAVYPHEQNVPLSNAVARDVEFGRGMSGGMTRTQIHTNLMSNGWYRDLPDDEKLVVWRTVENVVKDLDGDVRSVGGINKLVESVRKVLNIAVPSVSQSPFENEEEEPDNEAEEDKLARKAAPNKDPDKEQPRYACR